MRRVILNFLGALDLSDRFRIVGGGRWPCSDFGERSIRRTILVFVGALDSSSHFRMCRGSFVGPFSDFGERWICRTVFGFV